MNERPFQAPPPTDKFWEVGRAWTRPIPRGIPGIAIFGAWAVVTFIAIRRLLRFQNDVIRPGIVEKQNFKLCLFPALQAESDLQLLLRYEEVKDVERHWAVPRDPNWIVGESFYYTRYMPPASSIIGNWK